MPTDPTDINAVKARVRDALAEQPRYDVAVLLYGEQDVTGEYTGVMGTHDLRALLAYVERLEGERVVTLRTLTDEQEAHQLTAETLRKAIRDGDKAEQYRVERDKALREVKRLSDAHATTNVSLTLTYHDPVR